MENQNKPNGTRLFREALRKRSDDNLILYIVEVHEDEKNHEYFVNIRHIIENRTNAAFPISLCKAVIDKILESKEIIDEKPVFKLEKITPNNILSTDKKYFVEVKNGDDDKKFLHSGPVTENQESNKELPWNSKGYIELNSLIAGKMIKTLFDIMIRYQTIAELPEAPSLYSSSGGRRFFFDVRETRWGKRVQISQLTQKRRNTIGIPLENLIQFRDRLDHFIKELSLEDTANINMPTSAKPRRAKKTGRRGPPKPRKMKAPRGNLKTLDETQNSTNQNDNKVASADTTNLVSVPVPELPVK